eukprot:TRINITY_DN43361_c0_g1_i1.p1 TRINITY_DN43361_c0_g1~~TRINITY_DN43361_c0_g1_i1.p1  ORF type:complete len:444 (+),score=145.88 TRINITY_DN43361_c0_g1_i1:148-1332(+)
MAEAEQAELVIRQTHPIATVWGIVLDHKLRLKPASAGFPVADSAEYKQLIGWTLIGVNGNAVKNHAQAMEYLGKPAKPRDELKLHCRSPLPEDDGRRSKINRPCKDWLFGRCNREECKFLHQKEPEQEAAKGKGKGKGRGRGSACFSCGQPGHTNRDCQRWHNYQKQKQQHADKKKADAPCHPIGMSAAEAAADQLVTMMQQQSGQKRGREDGEEGLLVRLQGMREELRASKDELTKQKLDNETLRQRIVDAEKAIMDHQRHLQQQSDLAEDKLERKVEKLKAKFQKMSEAEQERNRSAQEKVKAAVQKGFTGCSDAEALLLAREVATVTKQDGWALLGLTEGQDSVEDAQQKARDFVDEFNPDKVSLEVCKATLSKRRRVAEHVLSMLSAPDS